MRAGQHAFATDSLLKRHGLSADSRGPSQFDAAQQSVGGLLVSVGDIAAAFQNDTPWGKQVHEDLQLRPFKRWGAFCMAAACPS